MDHETSEEMIPGHGRQQVMSVESAAESSGPQDVLEDASQHYDGFDDLTDDSPGAAGEY